MVQFDREAATNYLWKYALTYNPKFPDLSGEHGRGPGHGDCTNFLSQALRAGGWPMINGLAHARSSWWYKSKPTGSFFEKRFAGYASETWVNASRFADLLASCPRVSRCNESDLVKGDIVSIKDVPTNEIYHHMMVTMQLKAKDLGVCLPSGSAARTKLFDPSGTINVKPDVGLSYHSHDRLNVSLWGIKQNLGSDRELIYWKVKNQFADPIWWDIYDGPTAE